MSLAPGDRLGVYEIVGLIGAGGMGEVYRARDARLNRDVAIKVLPAAFAADGERIARLEREARVLASLNHPNIAAIHGFEEAAGVRGLVLELVDGPTLADRIAQSAMPLDEVLPIARQIADALEAAHDKGILHRDLKPANIKLTPDGQVKVLDFGLAKAFDPPTGRVRLEADLTASPTITSPAMTMGGVILGTAAYMSPEQAKGKPVDKRSDVWAFGCVLYEMLTSRRPFAGEDVTDTIVAVLSKEPDWTALPASTPVALTRLLRRALEKDRKRRLSDIADARLEIEEATHASPTDTAQPRAPAGRVRERIAWGVAAIAMLAVAALVTFAPPRPPPLSLHFQIHTEPGSTIISGLPNQGGMPLAVSPDGRQVVFVATTANSVHALWLRPFNAMTANIIPGTEGASSPFWKPDSRSIGFFADAKLKRVDLSGGPVVPLGDAPNNRNGSWGDGWILFSPNNAGPIFRVADSGGIPVQVTTLQENETGHVRPTFLPDGHHFLYSAYFAGQVTQVPVYFSSIDSTARTIVVKGDTASTAYASDHLLFVRGSTLMAQLFDETHGELQGEPFPVVENVRTALTPGFGVYSVSNTGVLVYQTGSGGYNASRIRWIDRSGKQIEQVGGVADYGDLSLSPDGNSAAITTVDPGERSPNIWIYDAVRQGRRIKLTFNAFSDISPVWSASPEGEYVFYASNSERLVFGIFRQRPNGGAPELVHLPGVPRSVSPDGKYLLYTAIAPGTSNDLWILPLSGEKKPVPFLQTAASEAYGEFSPDGNWIAYDTNEQQNFEVFVSRFPHTGEKWLVSTNGGTFPRWRGDGRELFYVSSGKLMAVEVTPTANGMRVSEPQALFDVRLSRSGYPYAVSKDGKRFLIAMFDEATQEPISVETNWMERRAR